MNKFHLLTTYFIQSVFFSLSALTSFVFFEYVLSQEEVGSMLLLIPPCHLHNTDLEYGIQNMESFLYGTITNMKRAQIMLEEVM